jgi:hypothetical protein
MSNIEFPAIKYATEIPETTRGRGKAGEVSPYQQYMIDMPAPALKGKGKDAQTQFAWFFVPAEVPKTITDVVEYEKASKDGARKLINRFTSMSRRIKKLHPTTHEFTFRKARNPEAADDTGNWGIVVYRVVPGTKVNPFEKKKAA